MKNLNFEKIFGKHFISCHIGFRKCQKSFWIHVISGFKRENPNFHSHEIAFFDDVVGNINMASKSDIKAFLFKNADVFKRDVNSLISLGD